MQIKEKNILVTGGTGFVGSHLIEELIKQKANIVTTFQSLNPLSYFKTKKLDFKVVMARIDVRNFDSVFDLITKYNIDIIYHLAAQALVDVAYHNPRRTLESNINGTVNILESSRLFPKVQAVIIASSDKVYGKQNKKKYSEKDSLKGDHPYEVSKSAADLIAYSYFKTYHIPVVTTRFGNIYGEGDLNFSRIVPGVMKSIIKKTILKIRSNGNNVRDYLYVKDVVRGYIMLVDNFDKIKGEAFNFGSKETLSVIELIRKIEKVFKIKINYSILNIANNEIPYQSLDYSKIMKMINWKPKESIDTTIKNLLIWYRQLLKNT